MPRTKVQEEDRFRVLWALALWEGEVSNFRVRQILGIQTVQVSRLIAAFSAQNPGLLNWDPSARIHRTAKRLKASPEMPGISEYLFLCTRSTHDGRAQHAIEVLSGIEPKLDPSTFSAVHRACLEKAGLEIQYKSLTSPEGYQRTIYPHALVDIGDRWLIRAWCPINLRFIDLMFDRLASVVKRHPGLEGLPVDEKWGTTRAVRLVAHSALPTNMGKLVRAYYFDGRAAGRYEIREALVPYFLRKMKATVAPSKEPPPAFQLEVSNAAEIGHLVFPDLPE